MTESWKLEEQFSLQVQDSESEPESSLIASDSDSKDILMLNALLQLPRQIRKLLSESKGPIQLKLQK